MRPAPIALLLLLIGLTAAHAASPEADYIAARDAAIARIARIEAKNRDADASKINQQALAFMSNRLAPALEKAAPGRFCILVCGGPVPRGAFHPLMVFAGRVPTLAPYLRRADLCIAPLFSGSGTRLKILEYLAARKPVAATPKAAEGIDCESGRHLLLAEPDAFMDAVIQLNADHALSQQLSENGFELVRQRYDWSRIRPLWRQWILT